MLKNRIEKTLYNPAIGLFPILLVIFLIYKIPVHRAVDIGLSVGSVMLIGFLYLTGKRVFQAFLFTAMLTLLLFNMVMLLIPEHVIENFSFILLESVFVVNIYVIKKYEDRIHSFLDNNLKIGIKIHLKPALQLFFFVSKVLIYCIPFHLLLLLIFRQFPSAPFHAAFLIGFQLLFPFAIIAIGVIELLNMNWIGSQIKSERYLPIVDANSRVIGHIALSESLTFEKKFLHPVVRVIFKHNRKLYLRMRPESFYYEIGKMCLPIEDYVNYGENIEDAAKRLVYRYLGKTKLAPHFLLKYAHEADGRKSLNYLFIVDFDKEKTPNSRLLEGGKWWTEQQIVENLQKNYFSSAFESEFEYIQTIVLMAEGFGVPIGMYSDKNKHV
ncbi:MAG: hypothetical protein PHV20_02920 [Bacteroidales bacterium]|nr:hypothetical protein [Bacteroidales bacterium]